MRHHKLIITATLFCFTCLGCASISQTAKDQLDKEVNCSTAEWDIEILEGERASVAKQVAKGFTSVMPAAAAVGVLTGDYPSRIRVASGKYNKDIDAKIEEIKATCGINK